MPLPSDFFPYPQPRRFQDEFMDVIFRSDKLIANVPTGVGKSISALCTFLADRTDEKIVVLTRTKTQAAIFLRELREISKKVKPVLGVHIRSKQEMCPVFREKAGYEEFVQLCRLHRECTYREKFLDMKDDIIFLADSILAGNSAALEDYGCPYMVALELARLSPVVVASYNYLLSPFLRGFFLNKLGIGYDELMLIVDEAHNLQNLDLLSKTLSRRTVELASKEVSFNFSRIERAFSREDGIIDLREFISSSELEELLGMGIEVLQRRLIAGKKISYAYRVASFFEFGFKVAEEENWISFKKENQLHIKPVLPAEIFRELKQSRKLLLMSGTLEPIGLYKMLLELEDAQEYSMPSIYSENIRYMCIKHGINSGMALRRALRDELWRKYAQEIKKISKKVKGVTLVFLPSYEVMEAVAKHLNCLVEPKNSREAEKLRKRVVERGEGVVLAVAGGKFSEGVEFTAIRDGERRSLVRAVVIAGLPFPVPDVEMEIKRKAYERKFGSKAFLLLSVLPMVNRILQACGRAVRSDKDRAVVVILDDRIEYLKYLPEDVRTKIEAYKLNEIAEEVEFFMRLNS